MRVCPECGYEDHPIWRNTKWRYFTEHCHINELEIWNPELANELKALGVGKTLFKNLHGHIVKYRLNKKGSHVHRIPAKLTTKPLSESVAEPNTEKHYWNPLSHKLEEFL